MIKRILPTYYFSLEGFYVYFLLFLFYIKIGQFPPIIAYLVALVIGNLFLVLALKQQEVSYVLPLLGGLLGGMIAYYLGLSKVSAILILLFIYFRIIAYKKNSELWTESRFQLLVLFYSSSLLVFFFGWIFLYPYSTLLYVMPILFTILFSIGRYLVQLDGSHRVRNIRGIFIIFSIILLLTGIFSLIFTPIVKWGLLMLLEALAFISFLFGTSFFNKLGELVQRGIARHNKGDQEDVAKNVIVKATEDHQHASAIPIWIWILLLVIILVITWFFIKKRKKVNRDIIEESIETFHFPSTIKNHKKRRFFRGPAPQEYVRKLIYQLQIYADKNEMGRYEHETVREWFKRVDFPINEEFILAYENVRYGEVFLARSEATQFDGFISDLKKEIKERSKFQKEREEK